MKKCNKCGELKAVTEFHKQADKADGLRVHCKECVNKANLERYHNNKDTREAHRRAAYKYTLKKYGMTIDDKINMYYEQDGKCGICKEPLKDIWGQHTHVDHCHTREEGGEMYVRGLLCMHCNRMLGGARDNIDILKEGIKWLEQHLPT